MTLPRRLFRQQRVLLATVLYEQRSRGVARRIIGLRSACQDLAAIQGFDVAKLNLAAEAGKGRRPSGGYTYCELNKLAGNSV